MFNQGLRQKKIAEQLGISCSTVCKIIKDNAGEIITLSDRIQMLLEDGKTPVEISRELNYSVRTVERYKVNPAKNRTLIGEGCDKNSKKQPPIYGLGFGGEGGGSTLNLKSVLAASTEGSQQHHDDPGEADPYAPFFRGDMSFNENDALALGIEDTAPARLEAAALGAIILAEERNGNLYIKQSEMKRQMDYFLRHFSASGHGQPSLTGQQVYDACSTICQKGLVVADHSITEGICYFLKTNHTNETGAAKLLSAIIASKPKCTLDIDVIPMAIQQYEAEAGLTLSTGQKDAIRLALTNPVAVITGGPGTGKTVTMAALCQVLQLVAPTARVKLCAPTGKAAVHLGRITGVPAKTIHALKSSKINCDWLIIDEASMVDVQLLHDMLKMVGQGAHILFVGDSDQLPCVGGGNVLRNLLLSKRVPVVQLSQVYRQDEQSGIVKYVNAIRGAQDGIQIPSSSSMTDDICFIQLEDAPTIKRKVTKIAEYLKNMGLSDADIQVLAPTRAWAEDLNKQLRPVFNSCARGCEPAPFTVGDRVIYLENDYTRNLHNGQEGTVVSVTKNTLSVDYGRQTVRHKKAAWDHLELAYAMTIHKAQGSEFPVVIIPVHKSMGPILSRNLIYTGITRAKTKCVIVGSEQALHMALGRTLSDTHCSLLAERLANA